MASLLAYAEISERIALECRTASSCGGTVRQNFRLQTVQTTPSTGSLMGGGPDEHGGALAETAPKSMLE